MTKNKAIFTIMKYKKFVILLIILLRFFSQGLSQDNRLQVKTYTSANGISEVVHSYIMMDSLGYIWTYGSNTAHRFDGTEFRNYNIAIAPEGQKENINLHRMYCSPDNDVLICSSAGAFILDRSTDKFVSIMDGFPNHPDQVLSELTGAVKIGDVLYFSAFVGLYAYHTENKTWQYFDLTPEISHKNNHHSEKVFWCIGTDKYNYNNIILFGKNRFIRFDATDQKVLDYNVLAKIDKHNVSIHNFNQTGPNNFFLSTFGRGIVKYNSNINTAKILYNESSIAYEGIDFLITHSNCLIGSEIVSTSYNDYIKFVDTLTGKARTSVRMSKYSFDYTTFGDDIYWGTNIKGLIKSNPSLETRNKVNLPTEIRLSRTVFNNTGNQALMQLSDGKLYSYSIVDNSLKSLGKSAAGDCLFHDPYEDEFLLKTIGNNIEVFEGNTLKLKRTLPLKFEKRIFDFKSNDTCYLIIYNENLQFYDRKNGTLQKSFPIPKQYFEYKGLYGLKINLINDTLIILQNQQYTLSLNLNTGLIKEHAEIRNLGSFSIISMDGINFYSSLEQSGLIKLTYNAKEGIFHREPLPWSQDSYELNYTAVQNDSLIWLISKDHVRVFNIKSETYDLIYSLPISPANMLWHITFTETNAIFSNEHTVFKIPLERTPISIHSINLEHVDIGDERTYSNSYMTFPNTQKVLGFEWSAPCYQNNEYLQFYTKLEGRDDRWVLNDKKNTKLYLGLSPGEYAFRVKAIMNGSAPVESTLYEFKIKYPWYATWWFILLASVVGILFAYLLYRSRVRSITEKTRLDKHIAQLELKALRAQLNPHFIFNSLNSIKRLIQINENKTAIEYLLLFSSMIRNVLDLSDKKAITLREELDFSTKYLKMEKMRFDKNFDFVVQVENDEILDSYSIASMILQPHLENAIWHGIMPLRERKGKLYLDIIENDESIIIRIEDNGIGRAASKVLSKNNKGHIHKSKGQSLSIDRLKLSALAREQEISTEIIDKDPTGPNPGTIIKIKLKLSNK